MGVLDYPWQVKFMNLCFETFKPSHLNIQNYHTQYQMNFVTKTKVTQHFQRDQSLFQARVRAEEKMVG